MELKLRLWALQGLSPRRPLGVSSGFTPITLFYRIHPTLDPTRDNRYKSRQLSICISHGERGGMGGGDSVSVACPL